MKQIMTRKYKYSYKDIFRWGAIVFMHYLSAITFLAIFVFISNAVYNNTLIENISSHVCFFLYMAIIGPFVNAMLHIIYAERGILSLKAILWLHSFACIIAIPIVQLLI